MATVAVPFTHFDLTCSKGDELPDDHPPVALAPHLFEQPKRKKQPATTASPKKERP